MTIALIQTPQCSGKSHFTWVVLQGLSRPAHYALYVEGLGGLWDNSALSLARLWKEIFARWKQGGMLKVGAGLWHGFAP